MTPDPLEWLLGLEKLGMKFGLENMRTLSAALGAPERSFRSVLVAGTNGKGSVTAIVETALRLASHHSARYTSPHLQRLEERFVVDGQEIDTESLRAVVARLRAVVERLVASGELSASPTFFEVTTMVAFDLFRERAVDIAVLEVGLGGRLDATNISEPMVTAITTIAFDHQAQLGNTIESITREKAGIIKAGVPVVVGRLSDEAMAVITSMASTLGAPVVRAHQVVRWPRELRPALPGAHQVDNAIVALAILDLLADRGVAIAPDVRRRAVEEVRWPGRLERVEHEGTTLLMDAAHNPAGAEALASYLRELGWSDAVLIFAAMADKDAEGMLRALAPAVGSIICTTAPTPRAAGADVLAGMASRIAGAGRVTAVADPAEALALARQRSTRVVAAGSMFLIGPLRGILR